MALGGLRGRKSLKHMNDQPKNAAFASTSSRISVRRAVSTIRVVSIVVVFALCGLLSIAACALTILSAFGIQHNAWVYYNSDTRRSARFTAYAGSGILQGNLALRTIHEEKPLQRHFRTPDGMALERMRGKGPARLGMFLATHHVANAGDWTSETWNCVAPPFGSSP